MSPTFDQVSAFDALARAFRRARRAKRGKAGEPVFNAALGERLQALSHALRSRTWRPDPYRYFRLCGKKERLVSEASFRDRVVHHALVAALEPAWEPHFIEHSYACRVGRGTHAALRRARVLARRHPYALRMDIRRYFDSVDHATLLELLGARLADEGLLWLCARLLDGVQIPNAPPGARVGLPIGNLTSQFWANVYLDPLDQRVTRGLGEWTFVRYMDDMLVCGASKTRLWEVAGEIRRFCRDHLALQVKDEATRIAPVTDGIGWLGFRVFPGLVRLDRASRARLGRRLGASHRRVALGADETAEAARASSVCAHASHADTTQLRRGVLERARRPANDHERG